MDWLKKLSPLNKFKIEMGKVIGEKIGDAIQDFVSEFRNHLSSVKEEVLSAFQRDHDVIGRVLKCHLILESYMDSCIKHLNKDQLSVDSTSFRFSQKIDLLENKLDGLDSYFKGIRSLNTIRHKLAHNFYYEITSNDVQSMKIYVELYKRKKIEDPIRMIEEFTIVACALLKNETVEKFAGFSKMYAVFEKTLESNPELYSDYMKNVLSGQQEK